MAILECEGLTKRYGGVTALDNVSLSIEAGHVVGLLGPNGSGKTTLIKLANGLLSPNEGALRICGMSPCPATKAIVSYLPDKTHLPEWMRAEALIDMYADFYSDFDRARCEDMLARLSLDKKQRLSQMSKGTKEKLQLILVMSRRAKLYLLDEPIGGVDPATRDFILDTIIKNYDPDAAVVISTHLISDVENILDEVIFINGGQVVLHSGVDEIREKHAKSVDALFREVFKC